jgi:hypothetical protein
MEIVKRGNPPSERLYEGACWACNTVIRFQRGEAKYSSDQLDGDFLSMPCPVCHGSIHVGVSKYIKEES